MATPAEVIDVGGREVRISNPDKIYFAERGFTKRDVVHYVISVGDGILTALRDRPTTMERWPGGVLEGAKLSTRADNKGDAFFQKRVPNNAPEHVRTAEITFPSGRKADEVAPHELAVIAWMANLGTLTYHPWPVRSSDVDHPDQLRIDLDPQPGTNFQDAIPVALELREVLSGLGLAGHPKTSGGRGIHVYVPIEARWTFVETRRAVIAVGRELARRMPDAVTVNWWKEERGERIFVDFNQMARDRTIASAYSIRPTARALVSAPVTWDELPDVTPTDFDVLSMPPRFAALGDLHAALELGRPAGNLDLALELADKQQRDDNLGDLPYPPDYPKMPGEPMRVQPSRARRVAPDDAID